MAARFSRFAAIDWSGAKGSSHPGITLAACDVGQSAPKLILPTARHWSRQAILHWMLAQKDDILIGLDFSFAPPFVKRGAFLPGEPTADNACAFWAYVDTRCDDEDLGAASFLEEHHRRHFYFGAADGRKADFMHLRTCEEHYNANGGGKPSTVFDSIGAAQVAKASFSGMRLLHKLGSHCAIWPFDDMPDNGPLVVEIYTQIAARAAGLPKGRSKIRDAQSLDTTLSTVNSDPHHPLDRYTDHATDAILASAWLRASANRAEFWQPEPLTPQIAATEGWTFGVI